MGREAYEGLELLFESPPSTFYRARNAVLGSEVMLRRLALDPARAQDARETFFREMRLSAVLRHPHIQRPLDVFEADGALWSVHEIRTLEPTSELVARSGPLPLADAARWGAQIADALVHLHAHGSVHGRVTPRLVAIDERGDAMLINLVKAADLAAGIWPLRPVVLGLSPFSPPEEFAGARPTPASDVYGLAATLLFWLSGRPVRGGDSPEEALERARAGAPIVEPCDVCREAPEALGARIRAALSDDPQRRGSMAGLASLLLEVHQRYAAEVPSGFGTGVRLFPADLPGGLELVSRHGAGAFGVVFRARPLEGSGLLAVKVLKPEHRDDPKALERFLREARAIQQVRDPHVVAIRGVGEHGGLPFAVMGFVDGPDLAVLLRREGHLAPARVARLGTGIARGLQAIHAQGIVHRDLKPHNVLVGAGDHPVIADFGIARHDTASRLTLTGELAGTPLYMAPELFAGEPATPAADLYSLGTILYELLTGTVPFPAQDALTAITAIRDHPAPDLPADLPRGLRQVVDRLLAKDPRVRPAAAGEVATALAGLLG